ncbi:MAG: prolipoprotein diacylglyceryl transferase [Fretibacterium sp.]|nr:prolipoprotein diacylglyceryl transferase [Fretibacterium sp.]
MYPVLFQIGSFRLDSYDVLWLTALSLAIVWSLRRLQLYNVDEDEARRVISWTFLAMLLGAAAFKPIWKFRVFAANPSLILTQGGLSEVGAVAGAFLAASFLCWRNKKISFQSLCDVAAPPAMLAIAVGRWGCFLNGCCVGIVSTFPLAVHFPRDPAGVLRHPTQLYYSALAVLFMTVLLVVERRLMKRGYVGQKSHHAVVAPLALLLYTLMRFSIYWLRQSDGEPETGLSFSAWVLLTGLPFEIFWLIHSVRWRKNNPAIS